MANRKAYALRNSTGFESQVAKWGFIVMTLIKFLRPFDAV
jgi:hypothetical protein